MTLHFRSLRSSSGGNCLMVSTDRTTILLDCGIRTQRDCRQLLDRHVRQLDAVIVSHAHSDHICHSSLRVLDDLDIPIHCHGDILQQIHDKHIGDWDTQPALHPFPALTFQIGDFQIQPVEVSHDPEFLTCGFVIRSGRTKIVVATDFHEADRMIEHLVDADFIFIEANHDLDLLNKHWNYASTFHLANPKTARILCEARKSSRKAPAGVMLGHLSSQRNTDILAMDAVRERFAAEKMILDFKLHVAPRYDASERITL